MELVSVQDLQRTLFATKVNQYFECASLGFYSSSYRHFHQNLRQKHKEAVSFKVQTPPKMSVYILLYVFGWLLFFKRFKYQKRKRGMTLYEDTFCDF